MKVKSKYSYLGWLRARSIVGDRAQEFSFDPVIERRNGKWIESNFEAKREDVASSYLGNSTKTRVYLSSNTRNFDSKKQWEEDFEKYPHKRLFLDISDRFTVYLCKKALLSDHNGIHLRELIELQNALTYCIAREPEKANESKS